MNFNNIRKQMSEFRERLSAFIDTLPAQPNSGEAHQAQPPVHRQTQRDVGG